ncbi:MAG: hypothetical protein MJY61_05805 [Bacteroidales bacterium]|nr:hypothetical protein [Bacteroidales bacterium]
MKKLVFSLLIPAVIFSACTKDYPGDERLAPGFGYEIPAPDALPYEYVGGQGDNTSYNPEVPVQLAPALMYAGSYIAEQALAVATKKALEYPVDQAFKFFKGLFGLDPTSESERVNMKLDEIISSLSEINAKLDAMYDKMIQIQQQIDEAQINILATQVQALNSKTSVMSYHNLETYDKIVKVLDAPDADARIAEIINEWAHTNVNGTEARFNALSYVDEMVNPLTYFTYHERKLNMLQVYDLTVFDAYPWEYQGYEDRELFREKVATEGVLSLSFAYIFYDLQGNTTMSQTCLKALEKFRDFMQVNQVQYDFTHARCQIRGAYLLIDLSAVWDKTSCSGKNFNMMLLNQMNGTTWYPNEWMFGLFNLEAPSNSSDAITAARNTQLTDAELQALINYYRKVSPGVSLFKSLQGTGIVFPNSYGDNTEIYIGTRNTETCMWITSTSSSHSYYTEFSNVYDAGHAVSSMNKKVAYVFYQGVYSFSYPNDYYSAAVNVPGYSGSYRHYRRWFLDTQATSYAGPGNHFFFFKTGTVQRYAGF